MWPFNRSQSNKPVPKIQINDVQVVWQDVLNGHWELSYGEILYTLYDNPIFDVSLINELPIVSQWIADLRPQIEEEIKKQLEGWAEWTGDYDLVVVDVSNLIEKREVELSYAHENWADLGINLIVAEGKILSSETGD
ncbi:hypothetical protein [Rubinisphaera italica]|uniref:DUF2262 domain-containing protein n=1 Tax=Rubinisphaera italica TaxID=2527969 RepID=A0A5C5XLZ7_9PLAN|nr:hypothetical protein [Rubinisphaera italica]TWT63579.1 hypothetical protein Pan54_43330 [Rubinisphaera italica]